MPIIQDGSADSIIAALGGNSSGMCRCPAHDDNTPSLHVSEGANGKVLVKCHAGCSQESVINRLKELRLWPANNERQQQQRQLRERRQADQQQERERVQRERAILRAAMGQLGYGVGCEIPGESWDRNRSARSHAVAIETEPPIFRHSLSRDGLSDHWSPRNASRPRHYAEQ